MFSTGCMDKKHIESFTIIDTMECFGIQEIDVYEILKRCYANNTNIYNFCEEAYDDIESEIREIFDNSEIIEIIDKEIEEDYSEYPQEEKDRIKCERYNMEYYEGGYKPDDEQINRVIYDFAVFQNICITSDDYCFVRFAKQQEGHYVHLDYSRDTRDYYLINSSQISWGECIT